MKRSFYKDLLEWKEKQVETPLMVIGTRQIGKTYIINEFCKENFSDYIYINLLDNIKIQDIFNESINTEDKVRKIELYLNKSITEDTVIFFDEIQESEHLISALKYFCESEFKYKIICGGFIGSKVKKIF